MRGVVVLLVAACGPAPAATVTVQPVALPPPPPVEAHIDQPQPVPMRAIDINLENKIHLVGVRIDPRKAVRGDHVTLTFVWRCDDPVGEGWQLFTHVYNPSGKADNLDYVGPLRGLDATHTQQNGPAHWEAGKTYIDEQVYRVPEWATGPLQVRVGIWRGASRLHVVSGPTDGENAAIAGTIDVN